MGGHRVTVTDRGKPVAELIPPRPPHAQTSRYDELVDRGVIRPPAESGDPFEDFPRIKLPRGTSLNLIDEDREEK
jgi:antitoxin (DNA-binding transcriptional repressor) of toxin-antitoxin stability system